MRCFVYLINQVENIVKKFAIEIPDDSNTYDLYHAALTKVKWLYFLETDSGASVKIERYEKFDDFAEFGDLHGDMDKIPVKPDSVIRFTISRMGKDQQSTYPKEVSSDIEDVESWISDQSSMSPTPTVSHLLHQSQFSASPQMFYGPEYDRYNIHPNPHTNLHNNFTRPIASISQKNDSPSSNRSSFHQRSAFLRFKIGRSSFIDQKPEPLPKPISIEPRSSASSPGLSLQTPETPFSNYQSTSQEVLNIMRERSFTDSESSDDETKMDIPILKRQAIGRLAQIGDLYDAYHDQVVKVNIFRNKPMVDVEKLNEKEIWIAGDNSLAEKLAYMSIEDDLGLSVISNLITPTGYGQFLIDSQKSSNQVSVSLVYIAKTQKQLQRLKDYLNGWKSSSNEAEEKFRVKIFTNKPKDFSEKTILEIFTEMNDYYHEVINSQENSGRGMKIGYILRPLSDLLRSFPRLRIWPPKWNIIGEKDASTIHRLFEKIEASLTKLNGLTESLKEFGNFLPTEYTAEAGHQIESLKEEKAALQAIVRVYLVAKRKGAEVRVELEEITNKQEELTKSIDSVLKAFNLEYLNAKLQYISYLQQQKVTYLGKNCPNHEAFLKSLPECYAFYCCWDEVDKSEDGELQYFDHLRNDGKFCVFIDQDVVLPTFPNQCRLCEYRSGSMMNEDLLNRYVQKTDVCYAKTDVPKSIAQRPEKAVQLEIRCPRSYEPNGCKEISRFWYCENCHQCYWYYENYFYCRCGGASAFLFAYYCDDPAHGLNYIKYKQNILTKIIDEIQPMRDIYILVLGLTGVGKSTWLNSFANYLTFSTLTEAANSEIVSLIPTEFSIQSKSMKTQKKIKVGVDSTNEILGKPGQAVTKSPKAYVFTARNLKIHFIDTPGVGDPEGLDKDEQNFDAIISYLQIYEELHGICVLVKPNEARLNIMFKYSINELLAHLHMDAAKNIIFCMTNSRQTFYTPGETLPLLQHHLEKTLKNDDRMGGVNISLNDDTVYCLDNEAIRYIYAQHNGVEFESSEIAEYEKSWNTSQQITAKMLEHIKSLRPHKMRDMMSLNETRRITSLLSKPLVDISRTIETNINALKEKQEEFKNFDINQENAKQQLFLPQFYIETEALDFPVTVCTSRKCVVEQPVGDTNVMEIIYAQKCHEKCTLKGVTVELPNNLKLKECDAMNGGEYCLKCKCNYKFHMHMTYNQKVVHRYVSDPKIRQIFDTAKDSKQAVEELIKRCEETIAKYRSEQKTILEISCKFGSYLKTNAIVPYNESVEEYVRLDINEEKRQPDQSSKTPITGAYSRRIFGTKTHLE